VGLKGLVEAVVAKWAGESQLGTSCKAADVLCVQVEQAAIASSSVVALSWPKIALSRCQKPTTLLCCSFRDTSCLFLDGLQPLGARSVIPAARVMRHNLLTCCSSACVSAANQSFTCAISGPSRWLGCYVLCSRHSRIRCNRVMVGECDMLECELCSAADTIVVSTLHQRVSIAPWPTGSHTKRVQSQVSTWKAQPLLPTASASVCHMARCCVSATNQSTES
jgi:hypothetical protein